MRWLSLKTQLTLSIAGLLGVTMLLSSFFVLHRVRQSVAEEMESAMQLAREWVEARLKAPASPEEAKRVLAEFRSLRHVRLVVDEAGIAPNLPPAAPAWFARWVAPEAMREDYALPLARGTLHLALIADPKDEIAEAWQETKVFLSLIGALALGFFGASVALVSWAFRPVEAILEGFLALERGEYSWRLPRFAPLEFARIASGFNHLAETLARVHAENARLTRRLLKIEEDERHLLARELHDELGQRLSAIKLMARSIPKAQGQAKEQAAQTILRSVDQLFQIVRARIQNLRPLMLDDLGLTAAIAHLVADWQSKQPAVQIALDLDETADHFLPKENWIHLYRIVQEALTNAFKHAQPQTVKVALRRQTSQILEPAWFLEVADDGQGANLEQVSGCGLRLLRERAESLGGRLELCSQPGQGLSVRVWLPEKTDDLDPARR
nr:methanol utilization control sensor protein MoxY [uncultured Gammaproteobacteria bacterium]